jgi:hypothetical protein
MGGMAGMAGMSAGATVPARDWDSESVMSSTGTYTSNTGTIVSNGSLTTPSIGGPGPGAIAQSTSLEMLRVMLEKRTITLTYMRNVHDGRVQL